MEVTFSNNTLHCLRSLFGQIHTGEQIQEIRLPDGFPDIGKILGCWGQLLIRGKEWRNMSAGANGGVMAWILYAPEDGTQPRVVEAWIPMQCRWDLPNSADDGVIHVCPVLKTLDARCISARKIMIRASADTFAQGMTRQAISVATPPQLPEDVQTLKRSYPAELPMEAGEKQVQMEERFVLPGNLPAIHKLVCYSFSPSVIEQKVLGNRLVFRGQTEVNLMYLTEDGALQKWQTDFPFSQYTELDRDYSSAATAWVLPVLTAMELEITDGQLQLRGGLAAQYTIFDRAMLEVVEDAFSPLRDVEIHTEQQEIPMLLDRTVIEIPMEGQLETDSHGILWASALGAYPTLRQNEDGLCFHMDGTFQTLSQNSEGQWIGESAAFETVIPCPSDSDNQNLLWPGIPMPAEVNPDGDGFLMKTSCPVTMQVYSGEALPMVTALELGELREPNPARPSIILCRAGEEGLWGLAKHCGSTVTAIQEANQLSGEPEVGQMLLIPVR